MPGERLDAVVSLKVCKANLSTLRKRAAVLDGRGRPVREEDGNERMVDITVDR